MSGVVNESVEEEQLEDPNKLQDCPAEPVPVSHLDILSNSYEVILNAKSKTYGRIYRDYQGCYVRLQRPCLAQMELRHTILRVECPLRLRDSIFAQCRDSIRRHTDVDKSGCFCNTTGKDIMCPGEPDTITYGDIEFDGVVNPRSNRYGWIFVEGDTCFVNAPLDSGQEPTDKHHNWKALACPDQLDLSYFSECPRKLLRRDKTKCFCEGVSEDFKSEVSEVTCPAPSFAETLELQAALFEDGLEFE